MASKIGKYEIQAEIGRGGFGCVYRALDPTVGRLVALKVFSGSDDPNEAIRFRNEATAAGKLRHANIVTIYEFGSDGGDLFIAMEYLEGQDLQTILAGGRKMSLLEKVNILTQSADGLACAQDHDVVHRDIKPSNLMILSDGTVKLLDFGIALVSHAARGLTQPGYLVGTLLYMAPELLKGERADPISDVFAFGLTAYELLTGIHPYKNDSIPAFLQAVNARVPPIRDDFPDIPEPLADIVERCAEHDRPLRYQSFREIHVDLLPILSNLKREHVNTRLEEIRRIIDAHEYDRALDAVRELLLLDPMNAGAREMRDRLHEQVGRRPSRGKVESALKAADEEVAQHRLSAAVQLLESAARADPTSQTLQQKLAQLRDRLVREEKGRALLAEAENALRQAQLTAARRLIDEAMAADPGSTGALDLLKTVQQAILFREQQRRLQDVLARSRSFLAAGDCEKAIQTLAELDTANRSAPEVRKLFNEAVSRKQLLQRERQLEPGKQEIKQLIAQGRFEEASQRAEQLRQAFPDHPGLAEILEFLRLRTTGHRQVQVAAAASPTSAVVPMPAASTTAVFRPVPVAPSPPPTAIAPVERSGEHPSNPALAAASPSHVGPAKGSQFTLIAGGAFLATVAVIAAWSVFELTRTPVAPQHKTQSQVEQPQPRQTEPAAPAPSQPTPSQQQTTRQPTPPTPEPAVREPSRLSESKPAPSRANPVQPARRVDETANVKTPPQTVTPPVVTPPSPAPSPPAQSPAPQPSASQPPVTRPAAPPATTAPPAAVPASPEAYHGPPTLRLVWHGRLDPGATLVIQGATSSSGTLETKGYLRIPRVKATVSSDQKVRAVEQPSEANGFRIVFRNDDSTPLETLRFTWQQTP